MEAVPKLAMLSLDLKESKDPPEFRQVFQGYIVHYYGEALNTYDREISELENLRNAAVRASRDITGCNVLKRYYVQLKMLYSRFPMKEGEAASVEYSWQDNFTGKHVEMSDPKFEEANILHNIGALHSLLGALDRRLDSDSMKIACTHFQCAAWAFQHVRDQYPRMPTFDLSFDVLSFYITLMLAQAQECILEKSLLDNRKTSIIAKVAAQVVEYYQECMKTLDNEATMRMPGMENFKEFIPKQLLELKISYYQAMALYHMGCQNEEDHNKIGERIAYLEGALAELGRCSKLVKNCGDEDNCREAVQFVRDILTQKTTALKKDNDFIYHSKVPDFKTLPVPKGVSLVKGIPLNEMDFASQDIFGRLIPMVVHERSSLYSEKKAALLRDFARKIDDKNVQLESKLSALRLDQLQLPQNLDSIPQAVLDCMAALRADGDVVPRLERKLERLHDVVDETKTLLEATRETIAALAEGKLEKNQQSELLQFRTDLDALSAAFASASQSTGNLFGFIDKNKEVLRQMSGPVESTKEALRVDLGPTEEYMEHLERLEMLTKKIEEMKGQREMLTNRLRAEIQADDIGNKLLAADETNLEEVLMNELKKHSEVTSLLEQNMAAQDNILDALTKTVEQLAGLRVHLRQGIARREEAISRYLNTFQSYVTYDEKVTEGEEFYRTLKENVSKIQEKVGEISRKQKELSAPKMVSPPTPVGGVPPASKAAKGPTLRDYMEGRMNGGQLNDSLHSVDPYLEEPVARPTLRDYMDAKKKLGQSGTGMMPPVAHQSSASMPSFSSVDQGQQRFMQPGFNAAFNPSQQAVGPNVAQLPYQGFDSHNNHPSGFGSTGYPNNQQASAPVTTPSYSNPGGYSNLANANPGHQQPVSYTTQSQHPQYPQTASNQPAAGYHQHVGGYSNTHQPSGGYAMMQSGSQYGDIPRNAMPQTGYSPYPQNTSASATGFGGPSNFSYGGASVQPAPKTSKLRGPPPPPSSQPALYLAGNASPGPGPVSSSQSQSMYQPPTQNAFTGSNHFSSGAPTNFPPNQPQQATWNQSYGGPGLPPSNPSSHGQLRNPTFSSFSSTMQPNQAQPFQPNQPQPFGPVSNSSVAAPFSAAHAGSFPLTPQSSYDTTRTASSLNQAHASPANHSQNYQAPVNSAGYPNQNSHQPQPTHIAPQAHQIVTTNNWNAIVPPDPLKPSQQVQSVVRPVQPTIVNRPPSVASQPPSASADVRSQSISQPTSYLDQSSGPTSSPVLSPKRLSFKSQMSADELLSLGNLTIGSSLAPTVLKPEVLTVDDIKRIKVQQNTSPPPDPFADPTALARFEQTFRQFESWAESLVEEPSKLATYWQELSSQQERDSKKLSMGVARCCPKKNRDSRIMPYDSTRVILQSSKDDYINASFIEDVVDHCPRMIATQTPLPSTYQDFWTMVLEQGIEVIGAVMTDFEAKESRYWPQKGQGALSFGPVSLNIVNEQRDNKSWIVRILNVSNTVTKATRTVTQVSFVGWPVESVPRSPFAFLDFVEEISRYHRLQRAVTKPILLHCSTGVGATGVMAAVLAFKYFVDTRAETPDFGAIVSRLRLRRKYMIDFKNQLAFVLHGTLAYGRRILHKYGRLPDYQEAITPVVTAPTVRSGSTSIPDVLSDIRREIQRSNVSPPPRPAEDQSQLKDEFDNPSVSKTNFLSDLPASLSSLNPASFSLSEMDGKSDSKRKVGKQDFNGKSMKKLDPSDPFADLDPFART